MNFSKKKPRSKPKVTLFWTSKPKNMGGRMMLAQEHHSHQEHLKRISSAGNLGKTGVFSPRGSHDSQQQRICSYKDTKYSKFIESEHERNVRHLSEAIIRKKSMADRKKDPNDFLAYPVYFFRQPEQERLKKKTIKSRVPKVSWNNSENYNPERVRSADVQDKLQPKKKNRQKDQNKGVKKRKVITSYEPYEYYAESNSDSLEPQVIYKPHARPNQSLELSLTKESIANQLPYLRQFDRQEIQEFADSLTRLVFSHNINSLEKLKYFKAKVQEALPREYPKQFKGVVSDIFREMEESSGFPLQSSAFDSEF